MKEFKPLLKVTLDENCETGRYTLSLHVLDHLVDNLAQLKCLEVLDTSPFEGFSVHVERPYRITSERRDFDMVETVRVIDTTIEDSLRKSDGMPRKELYSETGKMHTNRVKRVLPGWTWGEDYTSYWKEDLHGVAVIDGEGVTESQLLTPFQKDILISLICLCREVHCSR